MSDLVAAAEYNRRSVTPGSIQGNDGSFATPTSGVTSGGRNSVSPHPQAVTPPPNLNRPSLKINIPNRGSITGQMVRPCYSVYSELSRRQTPRDQLQLPTLERCWRELHVHVVTDKLVKFSGDQPATSALERCLPYSGVRSERVDCSYLTPSSCLYVYNYIVSLELHVVGLNNCAITQQYFTTIAFVNIDMTWFMVKIF